MPLSSSSSLPPGTDTLRALSCNFLFISFHFASPLSYLFFARIEGVCCDTIRDILHVMWSRIQLATCYVVVTHLFVRVPRPSTTISGCYLAFDFILAGLLFSQSKDIEDSYRAWKTVKALVLQRIGSSITFGTLARTSNFTRAQDALHVSQVKDNKVTTSDLQWV